MTFEKKINTVDKSLANQEQVTEMYINILNERMQSLILKLFSNNEGRVHVYGMSFAV